ncbi:unnamed protein product, partial [marine sediment metagenome]
MVAWWWIPIAWMVGGMMGFFALALFAANDHRERS